MNGRWYWSVGVPKSNPKLYPSSPNRIFLSAMIKTFPASPVRALLRFEGFVK
jgi:hypothetical protein